MGAGALRLYCVTMAAVFKIDALVAYDLAAVVPVGMLPGWLLSSAQVHGLVGPGSPLRPPALQCSTCCSKTALPADIWTLASVCELFYCVFLPAVQVPLIGLTEKLRKRIKSDSLGNMMFWASFCVFGQPMCLILYYHDWLLNNIGMQGLAQAAAAGAGSVATAAAASLASTGAAAINIVAPAAR
eukprot:GHRR01006292.1.p1 GENE.GHRR01006292.1~~GHRR01006292.1.p1  ORF type:complete len:185 (+),score=54.10 GHRR01006292.1:2038-2592(+)